MASGDETQLGREVDVTLPGGASVRAKGYRIMDLLWIVAVGVLGFGGWTLADHAKESKNNIESLVQAIKESSKATTEAMKNMQVEQRKANENHAITNCLLALPPDRRNQQAMDVCERIVRGRRND